MIKIEKDVPIPQRLNASRQRHDYPFEAMEVGDSIIVPTHYGTVLAIYHGRRHNKKFTSQKLPEGYRIWRIK